MATPYGTFGFVAVPELRPTACMRRRTVRDKRPPANAVTTINGRTRLGPAHKVVTASSLTSPPPNTPAENSPTPTRNTIRATTHAPAKSFRPGALIAYA